MPDSSLLLAAAGSGLVWIAVVGVSTWLASLVRHDVSLVDRTWSLMIAGPAVVYAWRLGAGGPRPAWLLALVIAWGVRLAIYVTVRNWGHGEDRRYQAIRARNQPHYAIKSLLYVFVLQMVLAWIVSAPTLVAVAGARAMGPLDMAGIAIALTGFIFEAVGDAQMARFKADPDNRGQVMDRGLWGLTRHPNYFGETLFWWGIWLIALGSAGIGGLWTVLSPLLMTVLLLKVSGVALLEKDIAERRPAYRDYIARTNAFFPGPRRAGGGDRDVSHDRTMP